MTTELLGLQPEVKKNWLEDLDIGLLWWGVRLKEEVSQEL